MVLSVFVLVVLLLHFIPDQTNISRNTVRLIYLLKGHIFFIYLITVYGKKIYQSIKTSGKLC